MASNRIGRINEEIQRELSDQLRRLKDPRLCLANLPLEDDAQMRNTISTVVRRSSCRYNCSRREPSGSDRSYRR